MTETREYTYRSDDCAHDSDQTCPSCVTETYTVDVEPEPEPKPEPEQDYIVRVLWYATNEVETHTVTLPPRSRSLAVHDGAEFYTNRLRREGVRMANFIRTDDGAIIKGARNVDLARVTAREA